MIKQLSIYDICFGNMQIKCFLEFSKHIVCE